MLRFPGVGSRHESPRTKCPASPSVTVAPDESQCALRETIRATRAVPSPREECVVDLVTLVAACALTVDPKLMHALVWHQSGGEPWSFSVPV